LAHKSGQQALTAPAPMQFLDPNELGMSIENSLNELKNNFKAANQVTAEMPASNFPTHPQKPTANQGCQSAITMSVIPSENKTATSGTASEFYNSSIAIDGTRPQTHMLSRDDSLVNLAMLTAMDGQDSGSYNTSYFTSFLSTDNDCSGFLHRDDSLIDLAASVERSNNENGGCDDNADDSQSGNNDYHTDAFSFIDFPNQM
jgi:hypothetical protein